jgi:hypothetical protein
MRCLTSIESTEWLRTHGIDALSSDGTPTVFGAYEVFCKAPKEFRSQQHVARSLVSWLGKPENCLLWITDWPFSSPDEMAIVSGLRRHHGELRSLLDAPGHLFVADELDELTAWVYLLMGFAWDGYVFASPYPGAMFQTSHEYFIWLLSDNPDRFSEAQRITREYQLKLIRQTNA